MPHGDSISLPSSAIAIVGVALRAPGAHNSESLWSMLEGGQSSVAQVSKLLHLDPIIF